MDFFATNTDEITEYDVRDWARQAICGWFTGHDDGFDELRFQQYVISRRKDGSFSFMNAETREVRTFEVAVVVLERP